MRWIAIASLALWASSAEAAIVVTTTATNDVRSISGFEMGGKVFGVFVDQPATPPIVPLVNASLETAERLANELAAALNLAGVVDIDASPRSTVTTTFIVTQPFSSRGPLGAYVYADLLMVNLGENGWQARHFQNFPVGSGIWTSLGAPISPTPLPPGLMLLGTALAGVAAIARKRFALG